MASKAKRTKKTLVETIKKVVAGEISTKYVAQDFPVRSLENDCTTVSGANLYAMLPDVINGTADSQRLGNSIQPTSVKNHFKIFFSTETVQSADIYVRLLCLTVKSCKNYQEMLNLPGGDLLLSGVTSPAGTVFTSAAQTVDPVTSYFPSDQSTMLGSARFQVNRKSYTVQHDRVFRLTKNQGNPTNDAILTAAGNPVNTLSVNHSFTTTLHPPTLKYDTGAIYPQNYAPVWIAWCWSASPSSTAPLDLAASVAGAAVQIQNRSEMWYKDA